jgi:hypothetical protein
VALPARVPGLLCAVMADRVVRGATFYRTVLLLPYAIAPAVAGVLWMFLFNPSIGGPTAGEKGERMRGVLQDQGGLFSYVSPHSRVRPSHLLRKTRALVRDVMMAKDGRPSVPQEQ